MPDVDAGVGDDLDWAFAGEGNGFDEPEEPHEIVHQV